MKPARFLARCLYEGVVDAVLDGKSEKIGKRVILGPSFAVDPRKAD